MPPDLLDPLHIALFSLALIVCGIFSGFIAGLLGVGGGIVIVPALYFILSALGVGEDLRMHIAVGTSLATIVFTSLISARSHNRRGTVDFPLIRRWAPGIVIGVLAGSALAVFIDGRTLTAIFAVIALVMSLYIAFAQPHWRLGDTPPSGIFAQIIGAIIGGVSALMGIGGGTLTVPTLSVYGYPIHRAVGTAAAIGFLIGVPGAIGFILGGWAEPGLPPFSFGYVNLLALLLIMPTSMIFAPIGAAAAHALPVRGLKFAFSFFLAATAIRMFVSAWG